MHYTEYFTLRDCSGFLQIRSHIINANETKLTTTKCNLHAHVTQPSLNLYMGHHCTLDTTVHWIPLYIGHHRTLDTTVHWIPLYIGHYRTLDT